MLETGIADALLNHSAITAIVGSTGVQPMGAAQGTARPFLTYQVTGRDSMAALSDGPGHYKKATFEIGVFADTYAQVMQLSEIVRDRLDQFGSTVSGVEFAPAMFDDETDVEESPEEGRPTPVYVRVMTFKCLYCLVS